MIKKLIKVYQLTYPLQGNCLGYTHSKGRVDDEVQYQKCTVEEGYYLTSDQLRDIRREAFEAGRDKIYGITDARPKLKIWCELPKRYENCDWRFKDVEEFLTKEEERDDE